MKLDDKEIASEVEVLLLAAKTYAMMLSDEKKKEQIVKTLDALIAKVMK